MAANQGAELRRRCQTTYEGLVKGEIRVVLMGKTGCGKSATGNTILNSKVFQSKAGSLSTCQDCKKVTGVLLGKQVSVIDSPGVFDTSDEDKKIKEEIGRSVSLSSPGPHVFLLVLTVGRYTKEDMATVEEIIKLFSESAAKHTIVLFTRLDDLEEEGKTLGDFLQRDKGFRELVKRFGNRYHGFNNRAPGDRRQVEKLMSKIEDMMDKNGRHFYTNEMYEAARQAILHRMEEILEERRDEIQKQERLLRSESANPEEANRKIEELWVREVKRAKEQAEQDNAFIKTVARYSGVGGGVLGALVGGGGTALLISKAVGAILAGGVVGAVIVGGLAAKVGYDAALKRVSKGRGKK